MILAIDIGGSQFGLALAAMPANSAMCPSCATVPNATAAIAATSKPCARALPLAGVQRQQ